MKLSEIRGHERIVERLGQAVERKRLPHAYLFSGAAGIGKLTTARAFATRLLCSAAEDDACGACSACTGVEHETHPDLYVLRKGEDANEIKIDQVRDLQRWIRLWPVRADTKVAILDDAHRMNLAAQNAMLKTFEEPPGSSILILVASNVTGLLPTVLSRCQRVDFLPLADEIVEQLLVDRCGLPPDQASVLAPYGEGSVGEALLHRDDLVDRARTQLLPLLEDLETRPYTQLSALAQEWGRMSMPDLLLLLRTPLAWYRRNLRDAAESGANQEQLRLALSQLQTVYDTMGRLRRHGHRQLALDTMLLDLQVTARRSRRQGAQQP